MKANEVPENMYIPEKIYLPYKDGKVIGLVKETGVPYKSGVDGNIEYTRTDTFIEKAEKWMKENFVNDYGLYCVITDYNTVKEMIEDFKNYMKGE